MDIAKVSMQMSNEKLHSSVNMAVMDMAMNTMDSMAQNMVDELILPTVTPSQGLEAPLLDTTV